MVERDRWSGRSAFLLAAIGSAVGLGNVWRFPFVAHENGGGAFLIPFFIAMLTAGIPLLVLELALGRIMQRGAPGSLAAIGRRWEWVGWWAIFVASAIVVYYAAIMGWCWAYLVHSVTLAWGQDTSSFFYQKFLSLSPEPGTLGAVRWPVLLGLIATWISIYLCISKGVKSVGKVVLITVPLPWLCLLALVARGVTLPGAADGLRYFLTPDFAALGKPSVWLAAYGQVFFSYSIGFGIMIAYSSYLPRRSDVTNDAFMIGFADSLTSFLAGLAVFSALGFLAHTTGVQCQEVARGGPGLAFVTYPCIISNLPFWAPFFGCLFFLMLLTLGIDSAFSLVEAAETAVEDKWGVSRRKLNVMMCIGGLLIGVIFATQGGLYVLDTADEFLNNFGLPVVGLLECLAVGLVYKAAKMRREVNEISEVRLGRWWDVFVSAVTPLILVVLVALTLAKRISEPYEGYPMTLLLLAGWCVLLLTIELALLLAGRRRAAVAVAVAAVLLYGLSQLPPWVAMLILGLVVLFGGMGFSLLRMGSKPRHEAGGGAPGHGSLGAGEQG
jgi:NSS family neurotransmitter:Na+ symporter